jgi:hypothetical protein
MYIDLRDPMQLKVGPGRRKLAHGRFAYRIINLWRFRLSGSKAINRNPAPALLSPRQCILRKLLILPYRPSDAPILHRNQWHVKQIAEEAKSSYQKGVDAT